MKYLINKKALSALFLVVLIAASSCKKTFLDVNDDPNRVTDTNVTPELIFTGAEVAAGARAASGNFTFLNNWLGYLASAGDYAIVQEETTYNIDFNFGDVLWQNHYGLLFDLTTATQKAMAKQDTVLAAACTILSAKLWGELVDIYGDIPYTEAFKNGTTRTPKYDDGKSIYIDLIKNLDIAVGYMKKTARSTFAGIDVINKGNKTLWTKFANTLKLRLLLRTSGVAGFDPTAEVLLIKNNGGILLSGETISVNPGYINDVNKQSPFYANYGYNSALADASPPVRANQYLINLLKSTADPRVSRFYSSVGGNQVGNIYGLAAGNPIGTASSKFGPGLLGENAGTANATGPTQNQWILTSVESLFLDAEAKALGWDTGTPGTAQTAYAAAVTESFVWLKVPNAVAAATTYLATPIAAWPGTSTQIKLITYQKYIALAGIDPQEAWADLRKFNMIPNTGYISVNPGRVSNTLPVRLLYPQSEYTTNSANVNAEGTINQFTSKIFWQP